MAVNKQTKLHREERRESIVRGAAEAFVEHGYEATSLEDVAEAAKVSRGLLYRHFDTKNAVYKAILDNFVTILRSSTTESKEDRVNEQTLYGLIDAAKSDPNGFRLFFRHAVREPDFKSYYEDIAKQRSYYIEKSLKDTIQDDKQRKFIANLLQELILSTLIVWIDNGLPSPESMPELLSNIWKSVMKQGGK
jgi:AcrR family transcriptional regulator